MKQFTSIQIVVMLMISVLITACSNDKPKTVAKKNTSQTFKQETTLKGKVSNDEGVVTAGEIKVTSSHKKLITTTDVQKDGSYRVKIPKTTELPIILTFYPASEDKKSTEMMTVIVYSSMTKYDISPLTTAIAKKAKEMGGYTASNMVLAAESTVHVPDANKTSTGFRGDPTKQYGGWH